MIGEVTVTREGQSVTVHVPLAFRRRGGRKRIVGEVSAAPDAKPSRQESSSHATILKALGRAWRWKRMLESGEFSSITDLAAAEKINHSYVRRILRLTLLSPEMTEQVLNRGEPKDFGLEELLKQAPLEWKQQGTRPSTH